MFKNIYKLTILIFAFLLCILSGCKAEDAGDKSQKAQKEEEDPQGAGLIVSDGMTLESRIKAPEGYARREADKDSLCAFLREYQKSAFILSAVFMRSIPNGGKDTALK